MRHKWWQRIVRTLLVAVLLPFGSVHAAWYTASGEAAIENDDVQSARQAAIDDALRNIMLESGADISALQEVRSGTLMQERINIQSANPLRKISVIEEQRTLNAVTVKVRAFVDEKRSSSCSLSQVRKSVLPLIFRFSDNRAYQTAVGLEDLPDEVGYQLFADLSRSSSIRLLPPERFKFFVNPNSSGPSYAELDALEQIADHYQTQFLLVGTLRSAALSTSGDNLLEQLIYKKTRSLEFNLMLYHTYSGALIFNQTYRGEADWDFKQGSYVDLRSERFLNSSYGQRLRQLCADAADDLVAILSCRPAAARVIMDEGDSILINLGSSDGLKPGLKFRVSHQSESYDRQHRRFRSFERSDSLYQVSEVFPETSRLSPVALSERPLSVTLNDIVVLEEEK